MKTKSESGVGLFGSARRAKFSTNVPARHSRMSVLGRMFFRAVERLTAIVFLSAVDFRGRYPPAHVNSSVHRG